MTHRIRDPRRRAGGEDAPARFRRLALIMGLPSLLAACAHPPTSPPGDVAATASAPVFRVGPPRRGKLQAMNTYAASLPELAPALSPTAIIEHILSRKRTAETGKAGIAPPPLPNQARLVPTETKGPAKAGGRKPRKLPRDPWDSLRSRLLLASIDHASVTPHIEELRAHPEAVDFLMQRAEPYLRYLLEEIDRRGLPADLVLVPMVESAFEAAALSPKQAAGLWQFIPATGAQYGLQLGEGYDGRYDTHASTQAALKHLQHLHDHFHGDWLLALAAYNAGEGAVERALEASRKAGLEGSFWDLDLPAETEAYVRKITALAHVIADPASYGLKPRRSSPQPPLARVEVGPDVRLADVVATAGLSADEFYRLNPAFKPDVPPPPQTYNLLLPQDKAQALAGNLAGAKVYLARKVVVRKGDTLATLAKRHGVSAVKLAEWNGLKPKAPLKAGQELLVFPA
ncbi:transglycosylase SLT domain-containing protein [Candidatus Methylocalor cossyra]|uniref:Membrane-bound lytic murein transglycosylase D n=1 Tax=Candidatus Methylocalor cossyra TaxID=3108543 RepID=A0ABM9NGD8_9GAMM